MENNFRITVADWLTLTLAVIASHLLFYTFRSFMQRRKKRASPRPRAPILVIPFRLATYAVTFGSLGVLAYSAYTGALSAGKHLTGANLITHATAAPVFVVSLIFTVLSWAHRNRFQEADWRRIRYPVSTHNGPRSSYAVIVRKIAFWILLVLSIPAALSVILSMFPLLTPEQQEVLLIWHRQTTLGVFLTGITFLYLSMIAREPAE